MFMLRSSLAWFYEETFRWGRHGASREEIAETVAMCVYMGGGPSLMYGAKALAAFDELSESADPA